MGTLVQGDIGALLEQAGARPPRHGRGKWLCPECGRPDLSVNLEKQVFHCFHAGCSFAGGIGTLRQRLGIEREWLPKAEYIRQCRQRESIHDAALRLYQAVKARRFELLNEFHTLNRIEAGAHKAGPTQAAWGALALIYQQRPPVEQQLDRLESGSAGIVLECLSEA